MPAAVDEDDSRPLNAHLDLRPLSSRSAAFFGYSLPPLESWEALELGNELELELDIGAERCDVRHLLRIDVEHDKSRWFNKPAAL